MRPRRATLSLLLSLLPVACGGSTGEFGAPRSLPQDQRPTQWDVPARQRLDVREMGKPEPDRPGSSQNTLKPPPPPNYTAATPAGWETQPPQPGRFRDLVWRVAGDASTECFFTAQTGGGVAMNMKRWYDQFGLPMAPAESLPAAELAGKAGHLLELAGAYTGKPGQAMMLVFTADGEAMTTLKFIGPEAVVKQNREAFLGLAKSLRPDGPDGEAVRDPGSAAGPQPQIPPDHGSTTAPFTATVPQGWTVKASTKALHHTFGADGEVYVSQLSGELRQDMDIWRGEIGLLAPLTDAEWQALPNVTMLGGEGRLLDVRGDHVSMSGKKIAGARLLVAAKADGGAIVFSKLVGKAAEVEAQVEAFTSFCASLRRAE